jgi:hypothetical protein
MTEEKFQKIELNLGKDNGTKIFNNFTEFENWLVSERSIFLNWINPLQQRYQSPEREFIIHIHNYINNNYDLVSGKISNIKPYVSDERFEAILKSNAEGIQKIYSQNKLLNSSSPRGKFIFKEKENDELLAAFIFGYFIKVPFNGYHPRVLEGAFKALQFDKGAESNIDFEKEALQDLKSKWESSYGNLEEKYNSFNADIEKLKINHQKQIKDQANEFKVFKTTGEEKLHHISETYDKKLALQSSISYWKKKFKSHNCLSIIFGIISLLSGIGIAVWLSKTVHDLIKNDNLQNQSPENWKLITLAIFTSLGIWIVRILVRIFLSNLHLANDAKERITMITTYLAMLRSGHTLNPEDKQLILQIIFRPSNSGLIKDEAAPPTIIDIFAKLNNGKK